ncbi:MAG: type I-E CRISPR-associated protein Cse2/CasB [Candidatus Magnetominusculus sp. LBB02]|nr:type I-E CRISPR-associated protein Cse2/CasB [Candidatus Magnetominusculus sp. LBB02]
MISTKEYIDGLTHLKHGELGLLRTHAGQGLDESVDGFDLFTGIWWPLRQKNERSPKRTVAWLIAKLYASCPLSQSEDKELAYQLGLCQPEEDIDKKRFSQRFDRLLMLPLDKIEPAMRWALNTISSNDKKIIKEIDWVRLTDDLSLWERQFTRLAWAEQFIEATKS